MNDVRQAVGYLKKYHGYSLTIFACVTGLHKNSLLRLPDTSWEPKPETMRKLARLIDRAEDKRVGKTCAGETIRRGRPRKE